MFVDALLVFDHLQHTIKVVAHCRLDGDVQASYRQTCWRIDELAKRLNQTLPASPYLLSPQVPSEQGVQSNVAKDRFLQNVELCREHLVCRLLHEKKKYPRLQRHTPEQPFSAYHA